MFVSKINIVYHRYQTNTPRIMDTRKTLYIMEIKQNIVYRGNQTKYCVLSISDCCR